ncbi:MAG: ABC transporter ATP-binding protein [Sphaerochaeta sp.]|nr:ABC transporter ATP-binding protein [Sphaerochaeta sp.]
MHTSGLVCALGASYEEFTLNAQFAVEEGELACIIGPSGCGKSTTLQLITGLLPLKEGSITLFGNDLTSVPVHHRQIAMVFQEYALFPHMSVAENIAYPLKLRHIKKSQRTRRVDELLSLVSLEGYEKRKSDELSGGEKQRVALARALASDPQLLLLDEPLSALDAKLRKHLREEIRRIHDETGITTLYVTHDQEEALSIADRIIVMHEGTVMQSGKAEEVYHAPNSLFVATFIGEGNTLPAHLLHQDDEARGGVIFFRPEQVTVHATTPGEYLPHLAFSDATVESCEFQGGRYRLHTRWQGHPIVCYCDRRPRTTSINFSVRKQDILLFEGTNSKNLPR